MVDRSLSIPRKSWNPHLRSLVDEEDSVAEVSEVAAGEASEAVGTEAASEEEVGAFGVGEGALVVIGVADSEVVAAVLAEIGVALAEIGVGSAEIGEDTATGVVSEAEAGSRAAVVIEVTVEEAASTEVEEEAVALAVALVVELPASLPLPGVEVLVVVVAMGKLTPASLVIFQSADPASAVPPAETSIPIHHHRVTAIHKGLLAVASNATLMGQGVGQVVVGMAAAIVQEATTTEIPRECGTDLRNGEGSAKGQVCNCSSHDHERACIDLGALLRLAAGERKSTEEIV